jgi:hypothetical protein
MKSEKNFDEQTIEKRESKEKIPYINKLIMEFELPYPSYGKTKEMTPEEIKKKYEKVAEELLEKTITFAKRVEENIMKSSKRFTTFAKEFLSFESCAILSEKTGNYGGMLLFYEMAGIPKGEFPKNNEERKKLLDKLISEGKLKPEGREKAYWQMKSLAVRANLDENFSPKEKFEKSIKNKRKIIEMRKAFESFAGKPLNEMTEKEIGDKFDNAILKNSNGDISVEIIKEKE